MRFGAFFRKRRKATSKDVWNKLFAPEPCIDCGGYDVQESILVFPDNRGEACLKCNYCGAKWIRRKDGYLDAYEKGDGNLEISGVIGGVP